jgi:triosephosphate isomerase (TIM)
MKNLQYICNWKTYLSFNQAREYVIQNKQTLKTLGKDFQITICASFDALSMLNHELQGTGISLGAQNCSAHKAGPYTGQVLASSLKEIGCKYCIIGHSETRKEYKETTETIAQKAVRLLEQEIIPISCIGESAKEFDLNLGAQVIEQQLKPLLIALKNSKSSFKKITIAYEPVWAIGNGSTPSVEYLTKQLEIIKRLLQEHMPDYHGQLFYGGNVNEINILKFKSIPLLDGILIGGASTDFQKLQKIVLS